MVPSALPRENDRLLGSVDVPDLSSCICDLYYNLNERKNLVLVCHVALSNNFFLFLIPEPGTKSVGTVPKFYMSEYSNVGSGKPISV